MAWIQNASLAEIRNGTHNDPSWRKTILIRCLDDLIPDTVFHKDKFIEVWNFRFDDVIEEDDPNCIKQWQADQIGEALSLAAQFDHNVIVHCTAGMCRSGAIAQFAIDHLGFEDGGGKFRRIPNTLVYKRLAKTFQLTNSWD